MTERTFSKSQVWLPSEKSRDAALNYLELIFTVAGRRDKKFPKESDALADGLTISDLIPLVKAIDTLRQSGSAEKIHSMDSVLENAIETYHPGGTGILFDAHEKRREMDNTGPKEYCLTEMFVPHRPGVALGRVISRVLLGENSKATIALSDLSHIEKNLNAVSSLPGRSQQLTEQDRSLLYDDLYKIAFQTACYLPLLDPAKDKATYEAFKTLQDFLKEKTRINEDGSYTKLCRIVENSLESSRQK